MPDSPIATAVRIEVDGQPLDPAVEPSVLQVTVDDHLLLPDTFEIVLQETPDKDVATKAHVKVGAKVVNCRMRASCSALPGGGRSRGVVLCNFDMPRHGQADQARDTPTRWPTGWVPNPICAKTAVHEYPN